MKGGVSAVLPIKVKLSLFAYWENVVSLIREFSLMVRIKSRVWRRRFIWLYMLKNMYVMQCLYMYILDFESFCECFM